MAKLNREAHALFVKGGSGKYQIIGEDIDDMSIDMNGSVDVKQNILGRNSVEHNGYTPSVGVEPYYANPEDEIYPFLKNIAMNRLKGDESKGKMLEVIIEDTEATKHDAWESDCLFEITSYGGSTSGFQIAFTVHECGTRTQGKATLDGSGNVTFPAVGL